MSSTEVEESGGVVDRAKADRAAKRNWFSRIVLFIQQVIAELKRVVTPTRKELINFTIVVIAFVLVMMALVWVLDQLFSVVTVFLFGTTLG
ncbi:preprotein translocase subunit SecE [Leucobacter sp. NPDC058333]|uniref:preprotein translocase subunit SecE n=1 Tax=Leucobacter sp. NPDC058333 TaxID=3346450 RepID=UPI003668379F